MLFNTDGGRRPAAPRVQKHACLKRHERAYVNRPGGRSLMAGSGELSPGTGFPYQEGMSCSPKAHAVIVPLMKDFSLSNLSVFIGILRTARQERCVLSTFGNRLCLCRAAHRPGTSLTEDSGETLEVVFQVLRKPGKKKALIPLLQYNLRQSPGYEASRSPGRVRKRRLCPFACVLSPHPILWVPQTGVSRVGSSG